MRNYDLSLSFIISAMFTAAFLSTAPAAVITASSGPQPDAVQNTIASVNSSGWNLSPQMAMPEPPMNPSAHEGRSAAIPSRPITDAQFQKVLNLMETMGRDIRINPQLTSAFGLSRPNEALTLRQIGARDDQKIIHTVTRLDDEKGYLVGEVRSDILRVYMTDKDLNLVAAVSQKAHEAMIVMPIPAAMQGINNELTFWAKAADEP